MPKVSRQSVSKWETGQAAPEMEKLAAISSLYKVSLDYLLKPSETDALSVKTMQLEQQQAEIKKALNKRHKISFLIVSIVVGILAFLAGMMLITGFVMTDSTGGMTIMAIGGVAPALLFVITGAVIVANYVHSRKAG